LRCAVWFTQLGFPGSEFAFPYTAQSPVTGKKISFNNLREVESEIEKVLEQDSVKKFGIGQTLYYEMPFFTNPIHHIKQWCWDMLEDYKIATTFNVPIGSDLDSISAFKIDCLTVIDEEINKINNHRTQDG